MSGSTQDQIVEVEDLLRNFNAARCTPDHAAPARGWSFAGRPVIAACLTILVFAPGCAAAAVFLMRADGSVPPVVTPDVNPPFVTKSDRLPIEMWSTEAVANLGPLDDMRLAVASANTDPAFLAPILIRGSLEDDTLVSFAEPATTSDTILATPRPRLKRDIRRARPSRVVAEIAPPSPPPPQPSFFEKLFGPRTN